MPIGEICNREVVIVQREDTVLQAAKLMRQHHVGDLLAVEEHDKRRIPVGIITDRDLVVEIVAPELDPTVITVGDIMVTKLVTIKESSGVFESIQCMRKKGIRRLPVVDDEGGLVGIVTLDDLLALMANELGALGRLVEREQKNESSRRR